jgi:hypothetical protein
MRLCSTISDNVNKMAKEVEKVDATHARNQLYQSNSSTNKVEKGENSTVI